MSYISALRFNKGTSDEDDILNVILQASYDGRLKHHEGNQGTGSTGDLGTLTAATGKDLYLTAGKASFDGLGSSAVGDVVLKINGSIVETAQYRMNTNVDSAYDYEFKNIGHKVDATQIIKLEVITNTSCHIEGFVQAVEVPDGENPTTYTGA